MILLLLSNVTILLRGFQVPPMLFCDAKWFKLPTAEEVRHTLV